MTERRGRRHKQLWYNFKGTRLLETGSTRSRSLENWLGKRLWSCRKADCGVNAYSINRLILITEKRRVFCEAVTDFFNVTKKLLDVTSVSNLPYRHQNNSSGALRGAESMGERRYGATHSYTRH